MTYIHILCSQGGILPLHYAASGGHLGVIQLLVEEYKVPADKAIPVQEIQL